MSQERLPAIRIAAGLCCVLADEQLTFGGKEAAHRHILALDLIDKLFNAFSLSQAGLILQLAAQFGKLQGTHVRRAALEAVGVQTQGLQIGRGAVEDLPQLGDTLLAVLPSSLHRAC